MTEFAYTIFQISLTKYVVIALFIFWILFIIYTVCNNPEQFSFCTVIGSMAAIYMFLYGLVWFLVSHLAGKESYEYIGIMISTASYPVYHIFYYLHRLKRLRKQQDYTSHSIIDGFKDEYLVVGCSGTGNTAPISILYTKDKTTNIKQVSRREFLIYMHDAWSSDLTKEEVSQYFEHIYQYINTHSYNEFRFKREIHLIEPLSARQETCSKLAIDYLFKRDFIQALHETLDVLSDFNKTSPLSYNECILIQNILITYKHLKEETEKHP